MIDWCLKQKKGIQLIDLNSNLSDSYFNEAIETIGEMKKIKGKWKIITGYYACYHAFYSILMKCGIKCEIHDCTIKLLTLFEFSESDISFLTKLKEDRIKAQYYLKDIILEDESKVLDFVHKCKVVKDNLSMDKIEYIRQSLEVKNEN